MPGFFYPPPPAYVGGRQPHAPRLGLVQSGPTPDAPPVRTFVTLGIILAACAPAAYALPASARIAPFVPAPAASAPLPVSQVNFRIIEGLLRADAWTSIQLCSIAPTLQTPATPATPDNPPVRTATNFNTILRQWDRPHAQLPQAGRLAALIPASATPDAPPITNYALRSLVIAQWIPPQWRPLPALAMLPQGTAPDTTPDQFTFTDQSGVATSSTITSASVTITGITAAAAISVTSGTYDINASGSFTSSPGTVNSGDTVRARHTSSASYLTAINTVVTIGGVVDTFTSITQGDPALAAYLRRPFSFNWWRT
jgi:hypothetical protein